ncbi:MAG: serine hydrolase [Eubacterium sp.]|nr:serine hydrolase [Eubacterium sp.]
MKKLISSVLCLIIAASVFSVGFSLAADKPVKAPPGVETSITGISSSITAFSKKPLVRTVNIKPATGGRTVRLQLYNSAEKKYKTVKTYETADAPSASLEITFPKEYRKKRTGKWRIVAVKKGNAERAVKKVTVTSKNIITKKLTCKAACVYCVEDKKVVYALRSHKRRKQASTTKIMTAIVLLDSGKYGGITKISKAAANTPYNSPVLKAGDKIKNEDLMYMLLLPSSNGAATAIGEGVKGSASKFVKAMNDKADELGLKDTHYKNPHGLDEKGHYSSAFDICREMAYIYPKSGEFRKTIAASSYTFTSESYKLKYTVDTRDKLKSYSDNHKGGKTGTTSGAGCCFTSVYTSKGKTYAVTVLGSTEDKTRWSDTKKLYSYIDNYASTKY